MSEKNQQEKRFVMQALQEWRRIKKTQFLPKTDDIYKSKIYKDWDNFFLLSLHENPSEWHFLHVGKNLRQEYWEEHYYHEIQQISPKSLIHEAILNIPTVINKQAPYSFSGQKLLKKQTQLFRIILLPLTDNDMTIDCICGGITSSNIDTLTESIKRKYNSPRSTQITTSI